MPSSRKTPEEQPVTLDLWLGAAVMLGLLVYLIFVLVRPERF